MESPDVPSALSARGRSSCHPAQDRDYQSTTKAMRDAARRLRQVLGRPTPSEVRRAYVQLEQAIGRAVDVAESRVRPPYRTLRPPPRVPLDPFAAAAWHRELQTLRNAREDVRFAALDDPHQRLPAVSVAAEASRRTRRARGYSG